MARTIVGILQILLRQDVTRRAPEINRALQGIQSQAARLGNAPWGAAFERQLDKLRVSAAERAAIVESYGRLSRDINGRLARTDLATWKGSVVAHLASVRSQMIATGDQAKRTAQIIRTAFGSGLLGGIATYGAYTATRGGVGAAFEQERAEAQAYFAGLPEEDRARIKAASEELSAKWGIFSADMFTVLKEASLAMPSTDLALGAGETMAKLFVVLESMFGREGAVSGIYSLNKALDNVEMNLSPEMYENAIDQYLKAQQVLGKDLSPESFAQALKYARIAGKALSEDFLFTWLPIIAAETSGSDAGGQVRANFDQLIGGRAPEKAKTQMRAWGVMDEEGNLTGQDVYDQNPTIWAHDVLLPLLEQAGIDTENEVELAQALAQMTNNRLSSDMLARSILSFEQYLRTATEYAPRAMGLDAADEVRQMDPFAAVTGMINSLKNLSAALGEHVVPTIIPAMNSFASGVETVAAAVRNAEGWQVGVSAIALAAGAFGLFKVGQGVFGGMGALVTAGPSLQTAATMLQSAAASLGGKGGMPPGGPGGKPKVRPPSGLANPLMTLAPWVADQFGTFVFDTVNGEGATAEARAVTDGAWSRTMERIFGAPENSEPAGASPYDHLRDGGVSTTLNPDATSLDPLAAKASETGDALNALSGRIAPTVDMAAINALLSAAREVEATMKRVGALIGSKHQDVKRAIDSSFSDVGISY